MTKTAEMVKGVKESVVSLGLFMIYEKLENYDEYLRKHKHIRSEWVIVRRNDTTLLTSLGSITYHKRFLRTKDLSVNTNF